MNLELKCLIQNISDIAKASIADHLINLAKNYSKGYINPNITDHLVVKDEVSKFLNVMVEELNG